MKSFLLLIIHLILVASRIYTMVPSRRIIGGRDAAIEDAAFMASLIIKFREPHIVLFSGGATLISRHWAVTAAHCVYDFNDGAVANGQGFVRSNTSNWKHDRHRRDHLIEKYIIHEKYINDGEDYDVALVGVQDPFGDVYEKPINFAVPNYEYKDYTKATTLGWGTTEVNVEPYTVSELRQVDVDLLDHEACTETYKKVNITLSSRMLCAGSPGKDACINDSGGPLVQGYGENTTLIGVVSWGIECASNRFPGVYTKVSEFHKWIGHKVHHYHFAGVPPDMYDSDSDEKDEKNEKDERDENDENDEKDENDENDKNDENHENDEND